MEEEKMKKLLKPMVLVVLILFAVACGSEKKPAEEAIKAAEAAINAVKDEAVKYVPDQVKGLEDGLQAAKDAFAKKDYKAALSAAKDLPGKAKEVAAAAAAKKTELTEAWKQMSSGLPNMVQAIKTRVDILSQSKKLPANLDKAKLESVKAGLPEVTQMWDDAQKAFSNGNLADAMSKAKTVKDKAVEMMTTLGMQVPAGAKS
jgi:PBP1b-binding outer membrane lipoprotein LpoB